jgi:hypothetical protein
VLSPNDQLTDGGPLLPSELPARSVGPPFGEAPGSIFTKASSK